MIYSILLDDNNYVKGIATNCYYGNENFHFDTDDENCTIVIPENFLECSYAYKFENGQFIYDAVHKETEEAKEMLEDLRRRRESECFAIVDRSKFWYNSLTAEQLAELEVWYDAWLNVTETGVAPEKLDWI